MITLDNIFKTVDEYEVEKYSFNTNNAKLKLNDVDAMQYFIDNLTDIVDFDIDTYDGNIVTLKNSKYNFLVQMNSDNTDFYKHIIKFSKLNID